MQIKYDCILKSILSDQRTLLIAERVNKLFPWRSLFNLTSTIEKIIYNSLYFFQENKIDYLLFHSTPHNLPNWVLAKTAELLGISVRMIQTSPLPYRYWIVEGLDIQKPIFPNNVTVTDFDIELLNEYIKLNQADYKEALPEYEKKRLDSRKGKFWSWRKEFKDILKNPKFLITILGKRKLFNLYKSLSVQPNFENKYIVFFLHFQPERTSMPEGLDFSNQWFIIKMISQTLPDDWELLVKEHPSTYTNRIDFKYRGTTFYSDIDKLQNVKLVPLHINTFDLIDNSQGVVTITGTVGVQSLIRNKPVLVFGLASYRGLNNVYTIKTIADLRNAFSDIESHFSNYELSKLDDLRTINSLSISGINDNESLDKVNFYKRENRINGNLKLLYDLFNI